MADYGSVEYWDGRYRREASEPFEWYQTYEALKPQLRQYLGRGQRVLVVGCGNSALAAQLLEDAEPAAVHAVDFSTVVVEMMRAKDAAKTRLRYEVMDVTRLEFQDAHFDVVVDKGTMDSVLCSDQGEDGCRRMCRGLARVLKPGGVYFAVSHSPPEHRKPYLQDDAFGWEVFPHLTLPKPIVGGAGGAGGADEVHYVYTARRLGADGAVPAPERG